jgi:hypothetical protein
MDSAGERPRRINLDEPWVEDNTGRVREAMRTRSIRNAVTSICVALQNSDSREQCSDLVDALSCLVQARFRE